MKKLETVIKEKDRLMDSLKEGLDKRKLKSTMKRVEFLKTIILYLQTKPHKIYLDSELVALRKKLEVIEARFPEWNEVNYSKFKHPRTTYNTIMNISLIKQQISAIQYILF